MQHRHPPSRRQPTPHAAPRAPTVSTSLPRESYSTRHRLVHSLPSSLPRPRARHPPTLSRVHRLVPFPSHRPPSHRTCLAPLRRPPSHRTCLAPSHRPIPRHSAPRTRSPHRAVGPAVHSFPHPSPSFSSCCHFAPEPIHDVPILLPTASFSYRTTTLHDSPPHIVPHRATSPGPAPA